ncbi:MAG: DUF5110 domain-containing protein [Salegentibacter sp.]
MRALVLEYPGDEETYDADEEFMFGNELLIAPVVKESARSRSVYLPEGKWIDFSHPEKIFDGEQSVEYDAPLDVIPMFVKAGAILPEMPVMPYIGAIKNAPMILNIFPAEGEQSAFEIYEDDGVTNDYKQERFMKTKIENQTDASEVSVTIHKPMVSGYEAEKRNFWLKLHLQNKPHKVLVNSEKLRRSKPEKLKEDWNSRFDISGYAFDKDENILYIRIPDNRKENHISIEK